MSSNSNDFGRAFEYACIIGLKDRIESIRPVQLDERSVEAARRAWEVVDDAMKHSFATAAAAFMDTLFAAEPLILERENADDVVELSINRDTDAEAGDVRDVVIQRGQIHWEIGLSMKHNHFAAKHSRLSDQIDFGKKWYGVPCDAAYWNAIMPLFDALRGLQKRGVRWKDVPDKDTAIYVPLLTAFKNELQRAYEQDSALVSRLISYLLGVKDFYKVVAIDNQRMTEFQSFNLRGELNQSGKRAKAATYIPLSALPTEIIQLRFKPNSTNIVELYLNNGWSLSFRIHSASTIVEPSLKFDVQFLGVPSSILTINCMWKSF